MKWLDASHRRWVPPLSCARPVGVALFSAASLVYVRRLSSSLVQASPSSQAAPSSTACWQPSDLSQVSVVQGLPSSQLVGVPTQVPIWHLSLLVQLLLSVQISELGLLLQPVLGSQVSLVHGLPSLHSAALLVCWQPNTSKHRSSVHGLPSSQTSALPDAQPAQGILDAAEELVMQHGFEGTSMRLLTAKAGVNLAAVNYHFGSKDALIEARGVDRQGNVRVYSNVRTPIRRTR